MYVCKYLQVEIFPGLRQNLPIMQKSIFCIDEIAMFPKHLSLRSYRLSFCFSGTTLKTNRALRDIVLVRLGRRSSGSPIYVGTKSHSILKSCRPRHKFRFYMNSVSSSQTSTLTPKQILPQLQKMLKDSALHALVISGTDPHVSTECHPVDTTQLD